MSTESKAENIIFSLDIDQYEDATTVVFLRGPNDRDLLNSIYAEAYASVTSSDHTDERDPREVAEAFASIACTNHGFVKVDVKGIHFGSYDKANTPEEMSKDLS